MDRWDGWNAEEELGLANGRDREQRRKEEAEEADERGTLTPETPNPMEEGRWLEKAESERKEACLEQVLCLDQVCVDEEKVCVGERCLSWNQKNESCHEPKEVLGWNEWMGQKYCVSQIGAG